MINFLKKNKILLIILIILVIICLVVLINSRLLNNNQSTKTATELKGYDVLKQNIDELDKDQSIPKNARFQDLKEKIISLEDPNQSKKQKYDILASTETNLFDTYLLTKNNKLYALSSKINAFSKTNFPQYYKENDFKLLICYDPICADSPQPKEILSIIDEINSSNLPDDVKKSDTDILYIYTYATKEQAYARVENYYFLAQMIKKSSDYEKVGLNIKISDEIMTYLNNNYADFLKKLVGK